MLRRPTLRSVDGPGSSYQGTAETGDDYDPHAFYVFSVDKQGHNTELRLKLKPDVVAEISTLIASGALGGTPITSIGAFIRDAIVHRMHTIGVLVHDEYFLRAAEDQRRLAQVDMLAWERDAKLKIIENARRQVEQGIQGRDLQHVKELVQLYEPLVSRLRDPYAGQLEDCLKQARRWMQEQGRRGK